MPPTNPDYARLAAAVGRRALDSVTICRGLYATPILAALVAARMGASPTAAQAAAIMQALGAAPPIHPLAMIEMTSETKH